jgi:pyridoxamine 5'-phosphate oxidase
MQNLADIRTEYTKSALDAKSVNQDPFVQFQKWFEEAFKSQVPEPTAANLATVNVHGRPTSRIILLKGVEENAFVFYTNYQSAKGRELELNPACCLTFFWPELERQIRIEGVASRVDEKKSTKYFESRPRGSQVGAWSSPQSTPIESREILEQRMKQIEEKFKGMEVLPKPRQWGGYSIDPFMIEFWQGRPNRLHDRIAYTKIDSVWTIHRLAPLVLLDVGFLMLNGRC